MKLQEVVSLRARDLPWINSYKYFLSLGWVVESADDVFVSVDEKFLFVGKNYFWATVLWKEHNVSDFDVQSANLTVFERFAWSNCDNCALVKLFAFWSSQDDASFGLCDSFCLFDDYSVK